VVADVRGRAERGRTELLRVDHKHVLVLDLQTGEGAILKPGGDPRADLKKHRVWVCPMFEPFLEWLYARALAIGLDDLPLHVDLPEAPFAFAGYRRPGPAAP